MGWTETLVTRALRGTGAALAGTPEAADAAFVIKLDAKHFVPRMILSPAYWLPEGYARGYWSLERGDLGDFARHMMDQSGEGLMHKFTSHRTRKHTLRHLWQHWLTPLRSTRAVKMHYNIDERIYEHILDDEMVYTAAFFEESANLYGAQQAKMARILERLRLPKGARVIDMGCGWGALARYIVRARPDVHVTGITISQGQLDWALAHNAKALTPDQSARLDLRLEDLRDHEPETPYDAVVSVGLFEHVGQSLYPDFFEACRRFCAPDGRILVHTILKNRSGVSTNRWIDRHIFPGGYIASAAEITQASEQAELDFTALFLHGPINYGNTCRAWRDNLTKAQDQIMAIYLNDHALSQAEAARAFRTWEIYLAGAEAGFFTKRRPMQTAQLLFQPTGVSGAAVVHNPAAQAMVAE